jgi:hypothetical protein
MILSMRENYKIFEPVLKNILGANQLEETSRNNRHCNWYWCIRTNTRKRLRISLRVREYNYNSFTLNRHSTDIHSEVHKWKRNRNSTIKAYHVQFNKISDDKVLVIRVNIDAFGMF